LLLSEVFPRLDAWNGADDLSTADLVPARLPALRLDNLRCHTQ